MRRATQEPLIPAGLRRSASFKKDLALLADLDSATIEQVAAVARAAASGEDLPAAVSRIPESVGSVLKDSTGAVSALALLQGRAVEYGIEKSQVTSSLVELLEMEPESLSLLVQAVIVTGDKRDDVLADRAFSRHPLLCTTEIHPVLRQIGSRLVPGLEWSLAYHDSHGDHHEFIFGLTRLEATRVLEEMREAIEAAERLQPIDVPVKDAGR